MTCVISPRSEA